MKLANCKWGTVLLLSLFSACQPKTERESIMQTANTAEVRSDKAPTRQQAQRYQSANKGRIETKREIPVFSRVTEQIVMFGIERPGQHVTKGQVLVRLSDAALREKILHCRAKLEKAEFQYQAILIGQGYKLDHLDDAPDELRNLARINSGYNEAKAELHELEHEQSYYTITAPVSGTVSRIKNTLYGAARPGEALFYIIDTKQLKVCFDVLENELAKYQMGASVSVSVIAYPSEQYTATVSAISPVIDDNGMVRIEATLEPHPHLMPGMTAFATIVTR